MPAAIPGKRFRISLWLTKRYIGIEIKESIAAQRVGVDIGAVISQASRANSAKKIMKGKLSPKKFTDSLCGLI